MKKTAYPFLATLLAAMTLAACGPKPAPGQPDRDRADTAFGQLKK
jgi:predicted small lipoprotein YifL